MPTLMVGINHKTAPIEIRERFYLKAVERELLLSNLKSHPSVVEALVISTCNRTEIYAHMIDNDPDFLRQEFFKIKNLPLDVDLKDHFYAFADCDAVNHLLRVSCGLDSLILGEKQILGQIKEAAELSRKKGMFSKQFNILTNVAIRTGKKARTETSIDCGGSSISWAAVVMAQEVLKTLQDKSVLIVGAGKMGHLAVSHLKEKGASQIFVTNRTHESAIALAEEFGGTAVSFWDLKDILSKVDVCICSASAPHYVIDEDLIQEVMEVRHGKQLVLIDISMPRNISPEISKFKNISLVTIDDLSKVVEDNVRRRQAAVEAVEKIIERKIYEYEQKLIKNHQVESEGSYKKEEAVQSYVAY